MATEMIKYVVEMWLPLDRDSYEGDLEDHEIAETAKKEIIDGEITLEDLYGESEAQFDKITVSIETVEDAV